MKNFGSLFFIVFCGIAASWICLLVAGAHSLNSSKLETTLSVGGDDIIIAGTEGLAAQGQQVYRSLGCVACHTQQVRRPGYGGDLDRDWGARQSVARDYVLHDQVMLGSKRMGPDLSNVGARHDAAWFYSHLNDPWKHADVTTMPSYPFLFKQEERSGPSSVNALEIEGNDAPAEGFEVVPTDKAVALVAYLQSLNLDYDLPESKRVK
jgi:cytochrome c oxidase cbb3-type subunit 2